MNDHSQSPVRAVLFDFGGVLYRTPSPRWLPFVERLAGRFGRTGKVEPGILTMMRRSPLESQLVMDIMTGKVQEEQVWQEFARVWRIHPAILRRLRVSMTAPGRLNHVLAQMLTGLRPRFKTAILTNAGSEFRRSFNAPYRLETLVDQLIISAEEGLAKPDPRFYTLAAGRLGVLPEEAIFFDDMPVNVTGALEAGMNAYLYESNEQVQAILAQAIPGESSMSKRKGLPGGQPM